MHPRKRKSVETAPELQPEKRVTRSSTAKDRTNSASTTSQAKSKKGTEVASTAPRRSKKETPKSKGDNTKTQIKTLAQTTDISAPANFSSLAISSDLIKNPIQCHSYSAPNNQAQTLIFTHGAGGDCLAPAVTNFCSGFSTTYPILAFNGSMNLASRVKGFHACIDHIGRDERYMILGGRSMGARAAVMAASEVMKDGAKRGMYLVLVSYPLQGPKDVRDQILLDLPTIVKVLFVIGDRDAMCPLDMLEDVRRKMKAGTQLVVVKGADHGMHVKPARKERDREVGEETGRVVAEWVGGEVKADVTYIGGEDE